MAEHDREDRTEAATPKRLREAAERGQIPRSRELTVTLLLIGGALGLLVLGPGIIHALLAQMQTGLGREPSVLLDTAALPAALRHALLDCLGVLAPLLAFMVVLALGAPLALGGWSFSSQALGFNWGRLNPMAGLGRLFSWQALMELGKALAKFALVGGVAVVLLWRKQPELLHLAGEPLPSALLHCAELLAWMFLWLALPMILVAGVDAPFQLLSHARQLRMTRQEIRDEMRDSEGKPEVKGRIRRLQHEFAQRRMMEKVPKADVVITNPTHYAIALQYQPDAMRAPLLVAKGADLVAARIRELAANHQVPRVESPLLARALYFKGELDKPIPVNLYRAVAQVLAYVYQLRQANRLAAGQSIVMPDVPVPPELRTL